MLAQCIRHDRLNGLGSDRKILLCIHYVSNMLQNVKIIIRILINRYLKR